MKKSGTIVSACYGSTDPVSGDVCWIFLPQQGECSHCVSCKTSDTHIQIDKMQMTTALHLDAYFSEVGILEVVVGIRAGQITSVLWHTLLLPLLGFLAGSSLGMILFELELASVILSGVGLVIGIMATRPLNPAVVCIEPVLDNTHPEMNHQ